MSSGDFRADGGTFSDILHAKYSLAELAQSVTRPAVCDVSMSCIFFRSTSLVTLEK
jgi:hypothetical protein